MLELIRIYLNTMELKYFFTLKQSKIIENCQENRNKFYFS